MADLSSIMIYFNFTGAIIAFFLGILKLLEYFKDKPSLSIKYSNFYYDYIDNKTTFRMGFGMINKGRRPITVINILVDILNADKKPLTIHSRVFEIKTRLLPQDHIEKAFSYNVDKKLPKKKYKLKLRIVTSYKTYKKIISVPYFDDFAGPIYDEISEGLKKGLIE